MTAESRARASLPNLPPTCPTPQSVSGGSVRGGSHEEALLRETCRTLSTCDALAEVLEVEGLTAKGSTGQPVVHPAVSELRQQRLALARLYASLRLPEGDQDERPTQQTRTGRPQRRGAARAMYGIRGGVA